jgi:hypothetical protein
MASVPIEGGVPARDLARAGPAGRVTARLLAPRLAAPTITALVAAVELAVADRKYGLFTGGFGQPNAVDSAAELVLFVLGYAASLTAVAMLAWTLCVRLGRGRPAWAVSFHFAFVLGGTTLAALIARYQLHSYFSDAVDFALLKQLGGGSFKDALLFGKNEIALGLAGLAALVLAWWALWRLALRLLGYEGPPAQPSHWRRVALALTVWLTLLAAIPRSGSDAAPGLSRMLAWGPAEQALALATDFDSDGYGLFGRQRDSHPFDAARHPLALDVPGNGVDEDGYAGDLALVPVPSPRPFTAVPPGGPNVIVVVMESTRADVLAKRIDGRPVAPHLAAIAGQGTGLAPAYSHVGFTTASLKSLFSGQLEPRAGDPALFAELKQGGYGINVFSGQPEDFGDISATVAMRENADIFVDAELLKDKRASRFAAQGSLLIDEGVLLAEFDKRLGQPEQWVRPQFVYFNFQTPHFPYDHPAVVRRFADPPLARSEISAARRDELARTYWNAVAHSDAALGALIERLKRLGVWDNTVLLVTGDHGESLFEDGFLGHGHIINHRQYGTFLAVNRPLPGLKPPLALSDYRAILLDLLTGREPLSHGIEPFMHIGPLDGPSAIGLAGTPLGIVSLRFDRDEACFERPGRCRRYRDLAGEERRVIDHLVARWGSERWAARQGR